MPRGPAAEVDVSQVTGTNSLSLAGPQAALDELLRYISGLDRLSDDLAYHRFDLSFVSPAQAAARLPAPLQHDATVTLESENALLIPATAPQRERIAEFLRRLDTAPETVSLRLRHTNAESFLASLPGTIPRRYFTRTDDPQLLLFAGPEAVERRVRDLMTLLDTERRQVRYDLLIIQYQEGQSIDYRLGIESASLRPFDTPVLLGRIGELLSISADIVSLFGHRFAVTLSSALSNNDARVLADTSVTALSGTPVSFRNTETYRYRDLPAAEEDEAEELGVTREITSGLFIDIDGRVRNRRTVSLSIEATVSKRGRNVGDAGTNPPPTAERVVRTALKAESGEPIVVGRFLLSDESRSLRRIPLLGQIPVLGWLFRGLQSSREESELVVYLVPHVLAAEERNTTASLLAAMHGAWKEGRP
jgi:type II secretory pathway component GspD/PulD (secretin)